jgi:hypothetical protein
MIRLVRTVQQSWLLQSSPQLYLSNRLPLCIFMLRVHSQSHSSKHLLLVTIGDNFLIELNCLRHVWVIGHLVLSYFIKEVPVVPFAWSWWQISLKGFVVLVDSRHLVGRGFNFYWAMESFSLVLYSFSAICSWIHCDYCPPVRNLRRNVGYRRATGSVCVFVGKSIDRASN